jgi:predicted secreted protein
MRLFPVHRIKDGELWERVLCLVVLYLLCCGASCQGQKVIEDKTRGKPSTTVIQVKAGQEIILQLYSDRTGEGYAWHYTDSTSFSECLRYAGQTYQNIKNVPGTPGAPGVQMMHFRAIRPGKALIRLFYSSRFLSNPPDPPEKKFDVTVTGERYN